MHAVSASRSFLDPGRPLRTAATGGRMPSLVSAQTTKLEIISRFPIITGDSDQDELRCAIDNGYFEGVSDSWIGAGQSMQLLGVSIERADVAQVAPFKWNKATTATFVDGAYRQFSDGLTPASLGLSVIPKQTQLWCRASYKIAAAGNLMLSADTVYSGAQTWIYDPANHIDQVNSTGALTKPTQAAASDHGFGPSAFYGRAINSGMRSVFVLGASWAVGFDDSTTTLLSGVGVPAHASLNAGALDGVIPFIAAARSGNLAADMAAIAQALAYAVDAAIAVNLELGGNDLAAGKTVAATMAALRACWAAERSAGAQKIVQGLVPPRTDTSNVPMTHFGLGGTAADLNAAILAALAAGEIDAVITWNALRASTDPTQAAFYQWANLLWTNAGTHMNGTSYPIGSVELRSIVRALSRIV